jgi:hypothetical protein
MISADGTIDSTDGSHRISFGFQALTGSEMGLSTVDLSK